MTSEQKNNFLADMQQLRLSIGMLEDNLDQLETKEVLNVVDELAVIVESFIANSECKDN